MLGGSRGGASNNNMGKVFSDCNSLTSTTTTHTTGSAHKQGAACGPRHG